MRGETCCARPARLAWALFVALAGAACGGDSGVGDPSSEDRFPQRPEERLGGVEGRPTGPERTRGETGEGSDASLYCGRVLQCVPESRCDRDAVASAFGCLSALPGGRACVSLLLRCASGPCPGFDGCVRAALRACSELPGSSTCLGE